MGKRTRAPRRSVRILSGLLALAVCLAVAFVGYRIVDARRHAGSNLHRRAFEATFEERRLPVPPDGPREGFWGARLGPKRPIDALGWHEPEVHLQGLLDIDGRGLQRTGEDDGRPAAVLIVGGSVAFGACASREETTYFRLLQERWGRARVPRIDVFGAGGWTSVQERRALGLYLDEVGAPGLVLVLDGLNDLTNGPRAGTLYDPKARHARDFDARVAVYLENVRAMAAAASARDARTVVAMQPSLFEKPERSRLEDRLVGATLGSLSLAPEDAAGFSRGYASMRQGLQALAREGVLDFLDCSILDGSDARTTFVDVWHFTDPGHAALARCLAPALTGERVGGRDGS